MFLPLMAQLRVGRDTGRPRTRPDAVRGDKAYSSRAIRAHLRSRGIKAVIPEPDDQKAHRKRRGSRGGRPVGLDAVDYRNRNVIERNYCTIKQWRGLATRYDKHAIVYRAADGQHHMVTLWFEDPADPWVIDPTGAMTQGMPRLSAVAGWAPLKVFDDTHEFTPRAIAAK